MSSLRPWAVGVASSALLFSLFWVILGVAESWVHVWERLGALWPWIGLLSAGFGLQVGLFWYIRQGMQRRRAEGVAAVVASGGVSTGAMVACCLHHGSDILPVIGLSAVAAFLTRYQPFFLTIGLMSNLLGISVMLLTVKRLRLYQPDRGILGRLARLDLGLMRNGIVAISLPVLVVAFWVNSLGGDGQGVANTAGLPPATLAPRLAPQEAEANGLTVAVRPRGYSPGSPLRFEISFDTHQGSLAFDLTQVAVLEDSLGNRYRPLSWEGGPAGGHHRSGTLTFPGVAPDAKWIQLTLNGLYGVPERTFRWPLK